MADGGEQDSMKDLISSMTKRISAERKEKKKKYHTPTPVKNSELDRIKYQRLKTKVDKNERQYRKAVDDLVTSEVLKPEEEGYMEPDDEFQRTYEITQKDLAKDLDVQTVEKIFELSLKQYGPYQGVFNRSGKELLLAGRKGHFAMFEWSTKKLYSEIFLNETVRDSVFLHSREFFALAQRKFVYIYNEYGREVHCINRNINPLQVDFLPYHFLLVTMTDQGRISWTDTSTGENVKETRTKTGSCNVMRQNPWNAVMCAGNNKGAVTMWAPNSADALVSMLCHRGAVTTLQVTQDGQYMATAGTDHKLKIWDVRNTYECLQEYHTRAPVKNIAISQKGMLAVAIAGQVQVWKPTIFSGERVNEPYMTHQLRNRNNVETLNFCPFEDVLGIGHAEGFSTIIIPGSGEPNFDSLRPNPYSTSKLEEDMEVTALLDKVRPDMISLNPNYIGSVYQDTYKRKSLLHDADPSIFADPEEDEEQSDGDDESGSEELEDYHSEEEAPAKVKKVRKEKNVKGISPYHASRLREDEKKKEFLTNFEKLKAEREKKTKVIDEKKKKIIAGESVALKRFF